MRRRGGVWIAGLLAASVPGLAWSAAARGFAAFPASTQNDAVLAWLRENTSLPLIRPMLQADSAVVIISDAAGQGPKLRRVKFREEAIQASYVARMGGRSVYGEGDVDCSTGGFRVGVLVSYAGSDLKGEQMSSIPARGDWRAPAPRSVLSQVVRAVCGGATTAAAPEAASPPRPSAPAPRPTAPAPPPRAAAPPRSAGVIAVPPDPTGPIRTARPEAEPEAPGPPAPSVAMAAVSEPEPPTIRSTPAQPDPVPPAAPPRPRSPAPARAAPTAASGVQVQIGAFSSDALARTALATLRSAFPTEFSGRSTRVASVEVNGTVVHRGLVGGFPSRASANSFCSALQAKKRPCFLRN